MADVYEPLVEAYRGYYEISREKALEFIAKKDKKADLNVFLHWNGILGYTDQILKVLEIE